MELPIHFSISARGNRHLHGIRKMATSIPSFSWTISCLFNFTLCVWKAGVILTLVSNEVRRILQRKFSKRWRKNLGDQRLDRIRGWYFAVTWFVVTEGNWHENIFPMKTIGKRINTCGTRNEWSDGCTLRSCTAQVSTTSRPTLLIGGGSITTYHYAANGWKSICSIENLAKRQTNGSFKSQKYIRAEHAF